MPAHSNAQYTISGHVFFSDNNQPLTNDKVYICTTNRMGYIDIIDSADIKSDGSYCIITNYSDSVLDRVGIGNVVEPDHVPTYYPNTYDWQKAVAMFPPDNPVKKDIYVQRIISPDGQYTVSGTVTVLDTNNIPSPLSGVLVIAERNTTFDAAYITDSLGMFSLDSLKEGDVNLLFNKVGYSTDSLNVWVEGGFLKIVFSAIRLKKVLKTQKSSNTDETFNLYQNFPNPFNPTTSIRFFIPIDGKERARNVKMVLYNILGEKISTLLNKDLLPGAYELKLNAANMTTGVYFYSLIVGDYITTKKMILLK